MMEGDVREGGREQQHRKRDLAQMPRARQYVLNFALRLRNTPSSPELLSKGRACISPTMPKTVRDHITSPMPPLSIRPRGHLVPLGSRVKAEAQTLTASGMISSTYCPVASARVVLPDGLKKAQELDVACKLCTITLSSQAYTNAAILPTFPFPGPHTLTIAG